MMMLRARLKHFVCDSRASVPIEYGMLAMLIAIVCVGAMSTIGQNANTQFTAVQTSFK